MGVDGLRRRSMVQTANPTSGVHLSHASRMAG
jgi:hypothetical protein